MYLFSSVQVAAQSSAHASLAEYPRSSMSSMSSLSLVQVALQPNVQTSFADVSPVA